MSKNKNNPIAAGVTLAGGVGAALLQGWVGVVIYAVAFLIGAIGTAVNAYRHLRG